MHAIETNDAPRPAGHYAQAIVHDGVVYVAGQLPIDPANRDRPIGSIEEQTERTLRNVEGILNAAGSGLDRVLQMTIYVSDISLWDGVNATYARIMGDHRPARAVVPVKDLHHGFQIEIQAIAAVRGTRGRDDPRYMFSTIAFANPLVDTSVAPSMSRSKS